MRQSRKRKSNPMKESLSWSKTKRKAEFESKVASSSNALLVSKEKAISVLNKGRSQEIIPDVSSSKRCLPRLQYNIQARAQEQINAEGSAGYSGEQAPLCFGPPQNVPLLEDNSDQGLVITLDEGKLEGPRGARRRGAAKKKREEIIEALRSSLNQEAAIEVEIDQQLDQELESKSRQHNLTTVNVRNIIHEVITNEHVVAMMKAAIAETEAMPVFEPKMTRSKLKEVVEKGVVIPTWNISPIKKSSKEKATQFVDIPLEEEDSSDDEYCPDEDEEDETAEETLLESDMESTASSPRGTRVGLPRALIDYEEQRSGSPSQGVQKSRHLQVEVVPMGPPPPPQPLGFLHPPIASSECSFMEKLHAVEEELATGSICMEPYQALSGSGHGDDLMAFRTRSKRPLRDVPLGQLEAELRAPDITPDMYECGSGPEDREWAQWLQGIMASDMENEEEGDDDDDPEYNFLEDIDEPDVEDYRNDRAVRITKKEVNELMEELFDTFHDDPGVQEGHEEEEKEEVLSATETPKFNVPQSIQFEEPLAYMLTKRHRTVREQLEALRQHRALFGEQTPSPPAPAPPCTLMLNTLQREQLQQQVQQHTQLLIQVYMLTHSVTSLQNEAKTSQLFLAELHGFAQRTEEAQGNVDPFISVFRACNLQGALSLLEELKGPSSSTLQDTGQLQSVCSVSGRSYPVLPAKLAWLFATRPIFLYPELLPHCNLDPSLQPPRSNTIYTRGEESLVVLGLRNFNETNQPYQLICQYLVCAKKPKQLRRHVHDMCHRSAPASPIKFFCEHKQVPPLPLACRKVRPDEQCPPVEREEAVMPMWLRKSLPYIHKAVEESNCLPDGDSPPKNQIRSSYTFAHGTCYPLSLPRSLVLRPAGFRRVHPASMSAPCLKPGMSKPPASAVADSTPPRLGGQMPLPNKKERARQMPPRDLCPIQPALPKPSHLELQLLPVPSGGVLNVVDLSRTSVGQVSLLEGEDTFDLGPASGCASILPTVVFGLVSSVVSSVVNPTLGGTSTRPFLLASSKNVNSSDPLGPTQNVTPLTAFPQSSLNPVSIAVAMNNRTVLEETPANKIPSCDAFLASCSSWKQNNDSLATTGAVCTSKEVFTSPLGMHNHTALLGETETQDVPVLTVSQEQRSCATRPPSQSCLILAKPLSNMQSYTGSVTFAVSQTEAQNSVVSQGRVDRVATTTKPTVTNCGVTKPVNALDCSEVPVALNTGSHASEPFSYSDTTVPKDACREVEDCRDNGASLLTLSQSSSCPSAILGSYANTLQRMINTEEGPSKESKVVSSVPRQRGRRNDSSTGGGVDKLETRRQVRWTSRAPSFSRWREKQQIMECVEGGRQTWVGQQMKELCKTKIGRQIKNTAGKEDVHLQERDQEAVSPASENSLLSIPQSKTSSNGMKHCDGTLLLPTTSVTTCAGAQEEEQKMERSAESCAQAVSQGLTDVPQLSVLPNPETDKEEEEHREHEKRLGKEYMKTFCEPPCPITKPIICARNICLTPSGERVILWTREADRAILEACQKGGANKRTFQAVSMQLGNKTASESCPFCSNWCTLEGLTKYLTEQIEGYQVALHCC